MTNRSLLQNSIFNTIKTMNGILFPIITFSYATRIIGVDGVGQVSFSNSFITYFTMLAMLGINYYGTREAAKLRDDKKALSSFCMEVLCINGFTTLLAYGLLFVVLVSIPTLQKYRVLLIISSATIVLQSMGMEWLYRALEQYRYIAVRSTLFQVGALIVLFVFVRNEKDVIPYAVITLIASSGSYILNFVNASKYIQFRTVKCSDVIKHLKPMLLLFAMAMSIELYTILDTTMLGFIKGDTAVGLYTAAIKVERMVNMLIASIGAVLIPRFSYFIRNGDYMMMKKLSSKAYNFVFMLTVPAAIGIFMLSDEIIMLLSGNQFYSAGFTMRIAAPIVILIPFSMLTNQQTFVPMGKEKLILLSTSVGAITNLILNSILIPLYAENGAAVATVISELGVAIVCLMNVSRFFEMKQVLCSAWHYWLAAAVIPVVVSLIKLIKATYIIHLILAIPVSATLYLMILLLLRNPYAGEAVQIVKKRLLRGKG